MNELSLRRPSKKTAASASAEAESTRGRILRAAERLFMTHGFQATSMRQITAAAEVNLAAVNYHFGSKEALIQEIFHQRLSWLNQERLLALERLERAAGGKPVKPSKILDAFFGTLLRLAQDANGGGATFLRLLGRTLTEPTEFARAFLAREYEDVLERYKQALFKALPDVPKPEIIWRFHFMLGATAYAIAGTDSLQLLASQQDRHGLLGQEDAALQFERLLPRLMHFLTGGLRAPLPVFEQADAKPIKRSMARNSA
jgi:AcrR family transcriptional regulator